MSVIFHDACNTSANYSSVGSNITFGGNNGMFGTLGASGSMHINFSGGNYVYEGAEKNLGSTCTVFQWYYRPASGATIGGGNTIFTVMTDGTYNTGTAVGRLDVTYVSSTTYKLTFIDPSNSYSSVAGSTTLTLGTAIRIVMYQTSAGWKVYLNNGVTPEITYTHTQGTVGMQYVCWGTLYENAGGSYTGVADFDDIWCGNLATAPSTAAQKATDAYNGYLQNHLSAEGQPYRGPVDGDNLSSVSAIDTASEGAAYLLMLAVQQNDQTNFILCDNWILQNLLRSNSTSGNTQNNAAPSNALNLMAYHYNSANTDGKGIGTIYDANWAGDADPDRMKALFWAHARWGSSAYTVGSGSELTTPNYLQRAKNVESDLYNYAIANSSSTGYNYLLNDSFQLGNTTVQLAPDYNNPTAFYLAGQYVASHASFWAGAVSGAYDLINKVATTVFTGQSTQVGLNSDWVAFNLSTGAVSTSASTYGDFQYGFNAFRSASRLYETYVNYTDSGALTALQNPKSFFTTQWGAHSIIYATFNHDGTNAAAYDTTYFTYPAYWSIYANDNANSTASAIASAKLTGLYYQEPYGSIISESASSASYGYFGQSWTIVNFMQQNGLWFNYGQTVSQSMTAALTFTGKVTKQTSRKITGGLTFVGGIKKLTNRLLTGGLSFIGQLTTGIFGSIAYDASSSSGYEASVSSYTWSHTCTGSNRGLLVNISIMATGSVSSITYNSVSMTFVRADVQGIYRNEIWQLPAPASGTHTIAVTLSTSLTSIGSAVSYTGVNQTDIIEVHTGATGTGATSPQATITPVDDLSWVVSGLSTSDATMSVTGAQTQRTNNTGVLGTGAIGDQGAIHPPTATTASWSTTGSLDSWAIGVVVLDPLGGTLYGQSMTGNLTFSGGMVRFINALLTSAALTFTGAVSKAPRRALGASLSFTGGMAKSTLRALSAFLPLSSGALTFDGSQNYLSLGTLGTLGANMSQGFYFSFQIKTTQTTIGYNGLVGSTNVCLVGINSKYDDSGSIQNGVDCYITSNSFSYKLLFGIASPVVNITDGNIHTIVVTASTSAKTGTITIDGSPQTITYGFQVTGTPNWANLTGNFILGARSQSGSRNDWLAATIGNVQIGTSSTALYARYLFTEGSGTTTTDNTGNGNTATLNGSPLPTWVNGTAGISPVSFSKLTSVPLIASLTFSGNILVAIYRFLTASLSFVGNLATIHNTSGNFFQSLSAGLSFSGNLVRTTNRSLVLGALTFSGAITKRINRSFSASLSFVGNIQKATYRSLTAAQTFVGIFAKQIGRVFTGALTSQGMFTKLAMVPLSAALTFTGTMNKRINKSFTGGLSFVGGFAKSIARKFTAAVTFSGNLTGTITSTTFSQALTASLGFAGNLSRNTSRKFIAALNFAGAFKKRSGKLHTATISFSGNIFRRTGHYMTASLGFAGTILFKQLSSKFNGITTSLSSGAKIDTVSSDTKNATIQSGSAGTTIQSSGKNVEL